ncbi:MAG: Hsp70 family protein [Proteobacteria bacterium]|nr:Hsp70 family protein [Pseudomonadota bacterium]
MTNVLAAGIDLGTTYSSLAIVNEHGEPEIIPNTESERLTPSAVFFDGDTIVVGGIAKDAAMINPDQVVIFAKRQMGNPHWHFTYDGQRLTPVDISAMILSKLKKDAEQYLNCSIPSVVITVPAYFDDDRRRATITAGEMAGFRVLGLVNEPTAAAISFGVNRSERHETVLVYDLGGGTFDATVMQVAGEKIKIKATDGDHQLGGKDFEDVLMKYANDQFQREYGSDPTLDPLVAADLRAQAEKVKRELSKRRKTMLILRAEGKVCRVEITREQLTQLIKPLVDRTLFLVKDVLRSAKMKPKDIDRVLLVGGSTRVPAVRAALRQFFAKEPDASVNPDEAISIGAALMAAKKVVEISPEDVPEAVSEKVGGLQITDVTSHSLGIEAFVPGSNQRINTILIPRNSPIPTKVSKEFVTTLAGQTVIKVTIFQGEFPDPDLCNPVGEFVLSNLPPNRLPGRKVRVTISCGINGMVNVTALDIETGKETTTEVSYASGETPDQVSLKSLWLSSKPIE